MTTTDAIEGLHAELDLHADWHDGRLILADALRDAGSELEEGYRWLGEMRLYPVDDRVEVAEDWAPIAGKNWGWRSPMYRRYPHACLPAVLTMNTRGWTFCYPTRLAADNAAALAFARLPPERRAELLAGEG